MEVDGMVRHGYGGAGHNIECAQKYKSGPWQSRLSSGGGEHGGVGSALLLYLNAPLTMQTAETLFRVKDLRDDLGSLTERLMGPAGCSRDQTLRN